MSNTESVDKTKAVKPSNKTKIYINIKFKTLSNAINGIGDNKLTTKFNGTGQRIVLIPELDESTYLSYSSDAAGKEPMEQPFVIENGKKVKFKLQDTEDSGLSYKWQDIIQERFDLQLVDGKKSTYLANITDSGSDVENDEIFITISLNKKLEKVFVSWDPRLKIRR
jgi:hypothetical protein